MALQSAVSLAPLEVAGGLLGAGTASHFSTGILLDHVALEFHSPPPAVLRI